MNVGKLILNLTLGVVVIALSVWLYTIILDPIKFEKEKTKRYDAVKQRLMLVKTAQLGYKDRKGRFAKSWPALINTYKRDSIAVVTIIGNPDEQAEDSTVVVIYDTTYVPMLEKYFPADKVPANFSIDSLQYVPYSNKVKFNINAGVIEIGSNRQKVNVFEVSISEPELLHDMSTEYIDQSAIVRVGSMTEATYNGNWE